MCKDNNIQKIDSKKEVGYNINKTARYLKFAAINVLKGLKKPVLTLEQYEVLYVLMQNEGICQRELGRIMLKDRPNMTRLIKFLEKEGLILREKDTNSNLKYKIFLSKQGYDMVKDIIPLKDKMSKKLLKGINKKDLDLLLDVLEKIRINIEDDFTIQV